MEELQLIFAIISGIALLLFLIIKLKLNAFLSLLTASIWVGLWGGLSPAIILQSISKGMGDTLAFVATIVGLGAIFGAILEHSGGAQALAKFLLKKGGETKSRLALLITGFIVCIAVFFDVGIIILFPLVKALTNRVKKNVLAFALPLLTGLAVTHSFIPPTPGPVAVADILKVDLGYAIVVGLIIGLPVALICGLWLSKYITPAEVTNFEDEKEMTEEYDTSLVKLIFLILGLPIGLILVGSLFNTLALEGIIAQSKWVEILAFIGHPFVSLLLATLLALYFLGTKRGLTRQELFDVSNRSLSPAGSIILITGAGGVLKQMMISTGIGEMIAASMQNSSFSIVLLAYLVSALVRIMQGSATVAMLTAAGIVAAVIIDMDLAMIDKTLIMMAIAAGSIILSHVNDSGFWLVNRYLNQSVQQTLKSWTIQSTMISVTSFVLIFLIYQFV
ncbi:MAG: gluconate transporter [Cytophagales bacterium CG12_big_fil_rev_8_21_14_0_65_40_12]|nr:MAG: gluconate transporter [Cytophagales bacterium CG12_big_fil_rev_8_21_14_0_65_40_12]PIW04526.1 MAG: gluconate transporter [Cytophagales bacterium CG17_big_fil_post_rev_8_21_14_2_50_40_13]